MERTSIIYKFRRKCQTFAFKIFSKESLSKFYFKVVLNQQLNLKDPKTFNEKIQWMKLYYYPFNDEVIRATDKYLVREYIEKKGYKNLLVPLLGSWDNANEINFEKLPDKFVLKCNHGCAYNIVIDDKKNIDSKKIKKQLNCWLKENFGAFNVELHYSKIKKHKIICEKYLGENLIDYKFFCFNGEPKFIYISSDLIHDRQAQIGFYNLDGSKMELKREDYSDLNNVKFPKFFNDMVEVAKKLSKPFPFVRVDFFVTTDRYYFAELTFTPSAGMMPFNPQRYDLEYGTQLNIKKIMEKYEKK